MLSGLSNSRASKILGSVFTKQELLEFWSKVVDPNGIGMPAAIAQDIASFTGESIGEVLKKMETAKRDFKKLWNESSIDMSDPRSIELFYKEQFTEAYELANWHCGRETGVPPLNYAYAARLAQKKHLARALDFGAGIGTGSLCLASVGCEIHAADVAQRLLGFVGHRFRKRGFTVILIDLCKREKPKKKYYDLITCFDVLEHIPNQLAKLHELRTYLREGGYLLVNLFNNSFSENQPMHISSAGDWLSLIRGSKMIPDWSFFWEDMQTLVRSRHAGVHNFFASWIDHLQGL